MGLHYYRFFPGDYIRDTRHLSIMQHGAYRLLIDEYMMHGPIPNDLPRLERICGAFSNEERAAIEYVLTEYFVLEGPTWRHKRCDEERAYQQDITDRAVKANEVRWTKKRDAKASRSPNGIQMDIQMESKSTSLIDPNQNQNQNHIKSKADITTSRDLGNATRPRNVEIAVALRALGADILPSNPQVIAWAEQNIPDDDLLMALQMAKDQRKRDNDKTLPRAGYIDAILKSMQAKRNSRSGGDKHSERANVIAIMTGEAHANTNKIIDITPAAAVG